MLMHVFHADRVGSVVLPGDWQAGYLCLSFTYSKAEDRQQAVGVHSPQTIQELC